MWCIFWLIYFQSSAVGYEAIMAGTVPLCPLGIASPHQNAWQTLSIQIILLEKWNLKKNRNNSHKLQAANFKNPEFKDCVLIYVSIRRQNIHIHVYASHEIKLLRDPISIIWGYSFLFWLYQSLLQDSLSRFFLFLKADGLVIPRRGLRLRVEVYRGFHWQLPAKLNILSYLVKS